MFNLIQTFITVYETRNFTQAANQLFISQPTVTTHIQKLERALNAQLFIRQKKNVIPTVLADQFYPQAQKIQNDWLTAKHSLNQVAQQKIHVTIGASHSAATTLLPQIITLIANELDHIALEVKMLNSEQVFNGIQQHHIQIGIIEKPLSDPKISSFPLAHDHLVHAGDFNSPLWLIREAGSGINHFTHAYFDLKQLQPTQFIEMDNNDMIVALLKQGLGQSIISSRFLDAKLPFENLGPEFNRDFYMIQHAQENDSAVLALMQMLKAHVHEFK